ncbi:MAG: 16S rRNA (cytosine(1402)-N(4))-methyltransferase [Candidatus Magasanikbacteria bacterium CG_4_10_14_0_2_um_filter_37_12]|uniref:Ribosomal RNA small subunit methyltransferase H n=1 Tax=Candidatus Magasanikbacteria bacterium CG_4_10_14_0_2_um_filter_37_12 TaxID=1974637 RepID=A0A2M7V9Y2_9BACT|nr:MAG: 16S rRNA (cytosine(1402)-N(4))-methyltransferase [Candidatus Magasanikbacteria bacterium CG_4_10_14_0_2_um_filter_37_12]
MLRHNPVLLEEVLESLQLKPGMNIVDCTLGDAGHSEKILTVTSPNGKLLGIDADPESLLRSKQFLYRFADRIFFERNNFENLTKIIKTNGFSPIDGILIDLGWSSPQFKERGRGFSFQNRDEPLDMRYDMRLKCVHLEDNPPLSFDSKPLYGKCTAAEHLNKRNETDLEKIFREYGEEKFSKEIARLIIEKREKFVLETVGDLVDIILEVYRKEFKIEDKNKIPWIGGLHPSTKIFQALRIAVNDELGVIERVLPQAIQLLARGGRLAVISFHSLEDRIIKHYFKSEQGKTVNVITKKPIVCSDEEHKANPRARSAKLRVVEKI